MVFRFGVNNWGYFNSFEFKNYKINPYIIRTTFHLLHQNIVK
ncbi:Uncharacterised protein [Streptococcus pneumoniae]|nr:Uncharacterised protein [Streptococcus pneumoniae]